MFSASVDLGVSINTSQLGETPQKSTSTVSYEPEAATVADMFASDRVRDAILRQLVRIRVFDELGLFGSETVTPQGYVQLRYEGFVPAVTGVVAGQLYVAGFGCLVWKPRNYDGQP